MPRSSRHNGKDKHVSRISNDQICIVVAIDENDYTINDVNEIMTEISSYLFHKKGVSSRHMQHHMNFIRYRKIIKYTVE